MPRDKAHPAQLGSVRNLQGKFVARLQSQEFGQARDFSGPRRDIERRAIEDVLAIRAAGELIYKYFLTPGRNSKS